MLSPNDRVLYIILKCLLSLTKKGLEFWRKSQKSSIMSVWLTINPMRDQNSINQHIQIPDMYTILGNP